MVENPEQICQQCGKCCSKCAGTITASPEDIQRWILDGRFDILKHFKYMGINKYVWCDELWAEYFLATSDVIQHDITSVGELLTPSHNEYGVCPFRRKLKDGKYKCAIHDTKPELCRDFTPWKPGWAIDCNGNTHDVDSKNYTWCEAMKMMRSKTREI
jgi:Fe-S-cluster containining protein